MLNIEISTDQAEKKVSDLTAKVEALAASAEKAAKALNPPTTSRQQIKDIAKEMDLFKASLEGAREQVLALANATTQHTNANSASRAMAEGMSKAIVEQTVAFKALSKEIKDTVAANLKSVEVQKKVNEQASATAKVVALTITATEKYKAQVNALKTLELTSTQVARATEIYKQTLLNTGTAAEIYLANLQKQNREFGKSLLQVAKMRIGWRTLTADQKAATKTQIALNEALSRSEGLYKRTLTPFEVYKQSLKDIKLIQEAGLRTQAESNVALAQAEKALRAATRAEEAKLGVKARARTAEEDATAALRASIAETVRQNQAFGKTEVELLRLNPAFQKLSITERQAAEAAVALKSALASSSNELRASTPPLEQFRAKIQAAAAAQKAFVTSGGSLGASPAQFAAIVKTSRRELEESILTSARHTQAMRRLSTGFGLGTQAAAGFRAALQGANLGFGIFTGNTILVATAVFGLSKMLKESLSIGSEFTDIFSRAAVTMGGVDLATGKLLPNARALKETMLQLGETTKFSSAQVADAAKVLAQAGKETEEIANILPSVLNLATLDDASTTDAATKLINVMQLFKIESKGASVTADLLAKAALISTTSVNKLGTALGQAGTVASTSNISLKDTLTVLAALQQVGISASKSGTDLRNIIQSLNSPTEKAKAVLEGFQIQTKDFWVNESFDVIGAIKKLSAAFEGLSEQEKLAAVTTIFNRRTSGGAAQLVEMIGLIDEFSEALGTSEGTLKKLADFINNNAGNQLLQLGNTVKNVLIRAFDEYGGTLTGNVRDLKLFLSEHGSQISSFVSDVMSKMITATKFLAVHMETLLKVVGTIVAWKTLRATVLAATDAFELARVAYIRFTTVAKADAIVKSFQGASFVLQGAGTAAAKWVAAPIKPAAELTKGLGGLSGMALKAGGGISALVSVLGGWPVVITGTVIGLGVALHGMFKRVEDNRGSLPELTEDIKLFGEAVKAAAKDADLDLAPFLKRLPTILETTRKELEDTITLQKQAASDLAELQLKPRFTNRVPGLDGGLVAAPLTEGQLAELAAAKAELEALNKQVVIYFNLLNDIETTSPEPLARSLFNTEGLGPAIDQFIAAKDSIASLQAIAKTGLLGDALKVNQEDVRFLQLVADALERIKNANAITVVDPNPGLRPKPGGVSSDTPASQGPNADELREATRKYTEELSRLFTEYQNGATTSAQLSRELAGVDKFMSAVSNNSGTAAKVLREFGLSSEEGTAGLEKLKNSKILEFVSRLLGEQDGNYKNLAASQKKFTEGNLSVPEAMEKTRAALSLAIKDTKQLEAAMAFLAPIIADAGSGATAARAEFDELRRQSAKLDAEASGGEGMEQMIGRFVRLKVASEEEATAIVKNIKFHSLFDGLLKGSRSEAEKMAEAEDVLTQKLGNGNSTLAERTRLLEKFRRANTATGKVDEQNDLVRDRIFLLTQSAEVQHVADLALQEFGSTLEGISPEFIAAAEANFRLNKELSNLSEIKGVFTSFSEGVGKVFSGLFDKTTKGFKGMLSRFKDLFKALIADLVFIAAKNTIVLSLSGGNGGGGLFGSLFGRARGGGGFLSPVLGLGQSFFGLGAGTSQPSGEGSSQAAGFFQQAVSNAVASNSGLPLGGVGGGGGFGGLPPGLSSLGFLFSRGSGLSAASNAALSLGPPTEAVQASIAASDAAAQAAAASSKIFGQIGGGILGALQGLKQGQGGISTALAAGTYAFGGAAIGTVVAAGALGGTAAASTALAAIPVAGWVAIGAMVLNTITGGRLFGTKFIPKSFTQSIGLNSEGATSSLTRLDTRKAPLFGLAGGSTRRVVTLETPPELTRQASDFERAVAGIRDSAAKALKLGLQTGFIDALFQTITTVSKKGKEKSKTTTATINGQTFKDITIEEFQTRVQAETLIDIVKKSVTDVVGTGLNDAGREVEAIAQRWRGNADKLLEGANFLVAAQADIVRHDNTLGIVGANALTRIVNLTEELSNSGESLTDTYIRVKQSVAITDLTLTAFGVKTGKTASEFVRFSTLMVESLGGVTAATEKLDAFFKAFSDSPDVSEFTASKARADRASRLAEVGLSPGITKSEFEEQFRKALPALTPDELASWIEAGQSIAKVSNALEEMRKQATGAGSTLVEQVEAQIQAIAALGASEEELAQAREFGNQILQKALDDFLFGIEGQLAEFEGRTYTQKLHEINRQMQANILQAQGLGASELQLNRIRQLAAFQTAKLIGELRESILGLVQQFNSIGDASADSAQRQIDASNSVRDAELDRYQAAQDAIKQIDQFLRELSISELNPGSLKDRVDSAQANFLDVLRRAQGGDPDALQEVTGAAKDFLSLAKQFFGSTTAFDDIFQFVTSSLRALQGSLAGVPTGSGGSGGGEAGSSSSSTQATPEQIAADKFQVALQLSQQLGDLASVLGVSVRDLMVEFGVKLEDLATAFGIDASDVSTRTVSQLQLLSASLGVPLQGIIDELGITTDAVVGALGISRDDIISGNFDGLQLLADTFSVSLVDAMDLLGISFTDIAAGLGIKLDDLTAATVPELVAMAGRLGVGFDELLAGLGLSLREVAEGFGISFTEMTTQNLAAILNLGNLLGSGLVDMASKLGLDLSQVAQTISSTIRTNLETLPDVPGDMVDGLEPLLQGIAEADTTEELNSAMADLITFTQSLPEEQAALLRPILESLGFTISLGTGTLLDEAIAQTVVLGDIRDSARDLRDFFIDGGGNLPPSQPEVVALGSSEVSSVVASGLVPLPTPAPTESAQGNSGAAVPSSVETQTKQIEELNAKVETLTKVLGEGVNRIVSSQDGVASTVKRESRRSKPVTGSSDSAKGRRR